MFYSNPFAELSALIPPIAMQAYVLLMILFVVGGTLFDVLHKKSAKYFFDNWKNANDQGTRDVSAGEMAVLAMQSTAVDVLASGEFCNPWRRISHLLTMYGFVAYVAATIVLVFSYASPETPAPALWTALWYLGALLVCIGGYWFWFFIRVDVAAEGHSPFRLVRADLFIVSLLASVTAGLIWASAQAAGNSGLAVVFLALYILATTVLFGSIPWSKFSHMFFKPAAAFQNRVEKANGSRNNLPAPADSPKILGSADQTTRHY